MTTTDRSPKAGSGATFAWIAAGSILSVLGLWITLAGSTAPSAESGGASTRPLADLPPLPNVLEVDTTLPERARVDALTSASRR
jgi:hypothetical protein